ncbi:MAG: tRNA pseudouridine synthase [Planctomycetota bacterium]
MPHDTIVGVPINFLLPKDCPTGQRMKLKSSPEDFRVDEITQVKPSEGPFALYKLSKQGLGTPEAIAEVLSRWNLARHQISYGGLKDRHATTVQYFTIARGPRTDFHDRSMSVEYLGQTSHPYHAKDIAANRFEIRLRKIDPAIRPTLEQRADALGAFGAMNYFDDQRFGSLGESGEWIGLHWCKSNYERALYLALAEPNPHDRPREKEQKEILRTYWGQWEKCKAILDRSHRRSIVTYLVDHPVDFKRALALIRQDLRGIYISAFQSWMWNRWLSSLLEKFNDQKTLHYLDSKCGPLALPNLHTQEKQSQWKTQWNRSLPLPSARQHDWPEGTFEALEKLLEPLGITVRELRLKYPRDTFFSRGDRSIVLRIPQFENTWVPCQSNPALLDWILKFQLPRGSYATMVIRQLFTAGNSVEDPDEAPDEQTDETEDGMAGGMPVEKPMD